MAVQPKGKPGRPASVEIYAGKQFGFLVIKRKVHTKNGLRWDAECRGPDKQGKPCGKVIRTKTQYLTRQPNPQTHCGCQTYINANPYQREKGIWTMMFQRTENPNHVSYKYYGGAGIKVCERWHRDNPNGWLNFITDMGGAPTKKHTIDRINPNLGYSPDNCRWATPTQQANNQRRHWEGKA